MIKDKVIVITGASSGIGNSTAKILASKGAKLVVGARRIERLEQLQNEITQHGGEVVISRSALRNGIGVGGRAASALAGIGVPGFANGFSSTYKADTSGTRTSQQTWASGRTVRGQFGAAASMAQNAPLREFQESVYQFRLSSIAYTVSYTHLTLPTKA